MQTFDQSVLALLREEIITEEEALRNCNNPNELSLKLKGISATSDRMWGAADTEKETAGASGGGTAGGPNWTSRE